MDMIELATQVVDSAYFDVDEVYENEPRALENLKLHLDRYSAESLQDFVDNLSDEKLYIFTLYVNLCLLNLQQLGNQNNLDNMIAESSSIDVLVMFNTHLELLIATLSEADDEVMKDMIAFSFDHFDITFDFFNIDIEDLLDESNASIDALIDRFNELRIAVYELVSDTSGFREKFNHYEYLNLN